MIYVIEYFQPAFNEWFFIHMFFDRDIEYVKNKVFSLRSAGFLYPLRIVDFSRVPLFTFD